MNESKWFPTGGRMFSAVNQTLLGLIAEWLFFGADLIREDSCLSKDRGGVANTLVTSIGLNTSWPARASRIKFLSSSNSGQKFENWMYPSKFIMLFYS